MAILKKTPIERFVTAFLKQHSRIKYPLIYVEKAIDLINQKIESTCCETPNGTVTYSTWKDNLFTNTIKMYLTGMTRSAENLASLRRTRDILNNFTDGPCCD